MHVLYSNGSYKNQPDQKVSDQADCNLTALLYSVAGVKHGDQFGGFASMAEGGSCYCPIKYRARLPVEKPGLNCFCIVQNIYGTDCAAPF